MAQTEGKKNWSRRTLWVIGIVGIILLGLIGWFVISWYIEFVRQTNLVVASLVSFLLFWLITDTFKTTAGEAIKVWAAQYDVWWSPWRMQAEAGTISFMVYGIGQFTAFSQVIPGEIPDHDYHEGDELSLIHI